MTATLESTNALCLTTIPVAIIPRGCSIPDDFLAKLSDIISHDFGIGFRILLNANGVFVPPDPLCEKCASDNCPPPLFAKIHQDFSHKTEITLRQSAETLDVWTSSFQMCMPDGQILWFRASATPERLPDGGVIWLGFAADITEEKRLEDNLRSSEQKYRLLLETSGDAMMVLRDGSCIDCNQSCVGMLGASSKDSLLGKSLPDFSPSVQPDGSPSSEKFLSLVEQASTTELQIVEWELCVTNGEALTAEVMIAPIVVNGEKLLNISWRNITRRKEQEKDQKAALARQEDLIHRRTSELLIAKNAAEAATRAKGVFLSNIGHEIRSPLNAIIGMSNLLKRDAESVGQAQRIDKIIESAQHLVLITNDIFDLSKIESGAIEPEEIGFSVDSVVSSVATLVREQASSKGITVVEEVSQSMPKAVLGDPLRISQVLANYASNAVKFTKKGLVAIRANLLSVTDNVAEIRFEVLDTGAGIDPFILPNIFSPFEHQTTNYARNLKGTGLGLTISKRLAEMMGGVVGAASELGKGSAFSLTIRLKVAGASNSAGDFSLTLDGVRALVVDDTPDSHDTITDVLNAFGVESEAAFSGEDAIQAVQHADSIGQPYDVLLIDWRMPGMDGMATAEAIRNLELSCQPAMILISAFGGALPQGIEENSGFDSILNKPVHRSRLYEALVDTLTKKTGNKHGSLGQLTVKKTPGARILVVDDDYSNLEVIREILETDGYRVTLASNGQEAIDIVSKELFDTILMDLSMPHLDGIETTGIIKRTPGREGVPVIAVTGSNSKVDKDACLAAGMVDFVAKPLRPETLYLAIERTLAKHKRMTQKTPQ